MHASEAAERFGANLRSLPHWLIVAPWASVVITLAQCSAQSTPQPSPLDVSSAARRAPADASSEHAERVDATSTAADAAPDADAGPPLPPVKLEIERPYKLYQRPRPKGEVEAAGHDHEIARWNVGGNSDPDFKSNRPGYHPAPRVRIDTRIVSGRVPDKVSSARKNKVLSAERVLAQARKYGYWPARLCFEEGLRTDQALSGESVIRFSIDTRGRTRGARVRKTKLSDKSVAECIASRLESLVFAPAPSARIGVELSVKLWPGDVPIPLIAAPKGVSADNPGELDAEALERAIAAVSPAIEDCQRRGMVRHPTLWGRVQVQIELGANGRVIDARQTESQFPHRGVARCVVRALETAAFAPAKGGRLVFVVGVRLGSPPVLEGNEPEK